MLNHIRQSGKFDNNVAHMLITRAVTEIFNNRCAKNRVRRKGARLTIYRNLTRKAAQPSVIEKTYQEEWEELQLMVGPSNFTPLKNLNWIVMKDNEFSLSFVHIESICYDGQRAVSELQFLKSDQEKTITISAKYHQRNVPNIESHLGSCGIIDKARHLMKFLESSSICHGFKIELDNDLKEIPITESTLEVHMVCENNQVEERMFSSKCEVLIRTYGKLCTKCLEAKKNVKRRYQRHNNAVPQRMNHKFMSREELIKKIEKITNEKRQMARSISEATTSMKCAIDTLDEDSQ